MCSETHGASPGLWLVSCMWRFTLTMNLQLFILAFQVYTSPLKLYDFSKISDGVLPEPTEPQQPANPELIRAFPKYIHFSAASYCDQFYDTQQFDCANCTADTTGTTMVKAVLDPSTEGAGYVAFNSDAKSIYVVFRGTANTRNWIENLMVARVDADWTTLDGRNVTVFSIY